MKCDECGADGARVRPPRTLGLMEGDVIALCDPCNADLQVLPDNTPTQEEA